MLLKKILVSAATLAVVSVTLFTVQVGYQAAEALSLPPGANSQVGKLAEQAKQAVFTVMPLSTQPGRRGGTGFLLKTPEFGVVVVTNRHVCETGGEDTHYFVLEQGAKLYTSHLRVKSAVTDLCLIVAPDAVRKTRRPYELAVEPPAEGALLHVFGHPFLRPLEHSFGRFVIETREPLMTSGGSFSPEHIMDMGRVDFMVFPGNSGSPVLNAAGKVVGVIFAMEGGSRSGLFVPLSALRRFLETEE